MIGCVRRDKSPYRRRFIPRVILKMTTLQAGSIVLPDPPISPLPLVSYTGCSDAALLRSNKNLATACACQETTNKIISLVDTYRRQVIQYNQEAIAYNLYLRNNDDYEQCAENGGCYGDYEQYQSQYKSIRDETKPWKNGCAFAINAETRDQFCVDDHGSGWRYIGEDGNCNVANVYKGVCQRSSGQALADWGAKFRSMENKPNPVSKPTPPPFNAQIAVTCCSQNLSDINGDSVEIYNITQQCSAEVNTYIQNVAEGNTTALPPNYDAPPPNTDPDVAGLQTWQIVLIAVGAILFIAIILWLGIRFRQKRKSTADVPTANAKGA